MICIESAEAFSSFLLLDLRHYAGIKVSYLVDLKALEPLFPTTAISVVVKILTKRYVPIIQHNAYKYSTNASMCLSIHFLFMRLLHYFIVFDNIYYIYYFIFMFYLCLLLFLFYVYV